MNRRLNLPLLLGTLAIFATAFVFIFAYQYISMLPWVGFTFSSYTGEIFTVDTLLPEQQMLLMPGDRIIKVGPVPFDSYVMGSRPPLHSLLDSSGSLELVILRDHNFLHVNWMMSDLSLAYSLLRLGQFVPSIIIIAVTVVILFFLRPIDRRYVIFLLSYSLTAIWLAGSVVAPYNIFYSATITRLTLWMCVPLYLQTGWNFPQPLLPHSQKFLGVIHLFAVGFATADFFGLLPINAFLIAIIVSVSGSAILMAMHGWINPEQRNDVRLVVLVIGMVMLPMIIGTVLTTGYQNPIMANMTALALPGAPMAALYTVYRRRLGGLELRINQAFTLFLFFLILLAGAPFTYLLTHRIFSSPIADPIISIMIIVAIGLLSVIYYPRFTRWTERTLLRIPMLPDRLLQTYAGKIATSLEKERLGRLLCEEIFPAMLVRQIVLIQIDSARTPTVIASCGVSSENLPKRSDIFPLMKLVGRYRSPGEQSSQDVQTSPCPWARLVLPLVVEGKTVGLCLLGRRDPDDFYSMSEFPVLQSLMDQTALALNNIEQSKRLREFHQANIERHESEQMALARTLHDEVLGQMALIAMNMPPDARTEAFQTAYQNVTQHVRNIINGLRPTTLAYGLRYALNELADEVSTQFPDAPLIEIYLTITGEEVRYAPEMEMHIYRIIQQACHNSVRHGHPKLIKITGRMDLDRLDLLVADDGVGFDAQDALDLTGMLNRHHFGLAGIYERAALIGATVQFDSQPGCGTRMSLSWHSDRVPREPITIPEHLVVSQD